MKKQILLALLLSTTALSAHSANLKGDAAKGATYYTVCAGCHGAQGMGNKAASAPRLQGQHDWYLISQLKNFKAGIRGSNPSDTNGSTMRAMAGTLTSDQAIADVVAYINTLK